MNNNPTKKQRLYLLIPIIQILLVEIAIGFSDWFYVYFLLPLCLLGIWIVITLYNIENNL